MSNIETLRALVDAVEAARSHLGAIRPDSRLYPEDAAQWDALTRVAALLSAGDGVAEGFVLVPREATLEMENAWDQHYGNTFRGRYRAMLAAAPAAPVAPENSHGGRPMTLREVMEAEEGAAPVGAIENGRALFNVIEAMDFECEGGPLRNFVDWNELRRCFEHLAEFSKKVAAPAVEVDEAMASGEFKRNDRVTVRFLSGAVHSGTVTLRHGISYDVFLDNGVGVQVGAAQVAALGREGGGNG